MSLQIRDIDTFYGTSHILHKVSLDIADGELFAVMGRNGAGKSTTLCTISGLLRPRRGSIFPGTSRPGRHLPTSMGTGISTCS